MSWNIFKRVAELEQQVKDLKDFTYHHSQWNGQLEGRLKQIDNELFIRAVESKAFSTDEERERKLQHRREQYAKNKADKIAKAKHNARQKAYRARQKEKQNA